MLVGWLVTFFYGYYYPSTLSLMYFDYKKKLYNRIFARVRVDNNKTTTDSLNEKKIERKQSGCCFIIYLIVMNIPIMIAYTLDI